MEKKKHCHYGHRDRLKKRYLQEGLDNFEDHNVIELLLFYGVTQKDTNELAHRLLDEFGGISQIFDAPYEELCRIPGIKQNAGVLLKLIPNLCRRYMEDKAESGTVLNSTGGVCSYIAPRFIGRTEEAVYLICIDNTNTIIADVCLMEGSLEEVAIPIEKIVRAALKYNVKNVILAHNHPFGLAYPSSSDKNKTLQLQNALMELEIRLIDHIIVGKNNDTISMLEFGYMDPLSKL